MEVVSIDHACKVRKEEGQMNQSGLFFQVGGKKATRDKESKEVSCISTDVTASDCTMYRVFPS